MTDKVTITRLSENLWKIDGRTAQYLVKDDDNYQLVSSGSSYPSYTSAIGAAVEGADLEVRDGRSRW